MDYDRNDALLHWLFRQTQGDAWFRPNEEHISSGVALRINDASTTSTPEFRVFPYENASLEPFETAVSALNPVVAVKVRSAAVHAALAEVPSDAQSISVDSDTRIQVLDTMSMLPYADREQCAAFIRDERVIVIWAESLDRIIPLCHDVEERLIRLLWRARPTTGTSSSASTTSTLGALTPGVGVHAGIPASPLNPASQLNTAYNTNPPSSNTHESSGSKPGSLADSALGVLPVLGGMKRRGLYGELGRGWDEDGYDAEVEKVVEAGDEVDEVLVISGEKGKGGGMGEEKGRGLFGFGRKKRGAVAGVGVGGKGDVEVGPGGEERIVRLYAPLYNGLAAGLALVFVGNALKTLLQEWLLDGDFTRFALLAVLPLLYCVSLFFTLQITQNLTMMFGPIAHYHENSKYYSAVRPRAPVLGKTITAERLPHVTIQMPVYKESLDSVLEPSIRSLKKAVQTYARQGGTASIFINDDGLRALPAAQRDARLAFYATHNIGWVARPTHGAPPSGAARRAMVDQGNVSGKKGKKGKGAEEPGFNRAGRFKKASNMNYALALSLKMERHLEALVAQQESQKQEQQLQQQQKLEQQKVQPGVPRTSGSLSTHGRPMSGGSGESAEGQAYGIQYQNRDGDESVVWGVAPSNSNANANANVNPNTGLPPTPHSATGFLSNTPAANVVPTPALDLEEMALGLAIEEVWEESGRRWRPWAANGRATRIGEIVLLVDADTVVPEDCLRDAAREMEACPTVAIIQHESDVMQVAHHYFENGISYFTKRINRCISISCANGEVAPFMGHNAFLRWRAIQDATFVDPTDAKEKVWSEDNVSEDFDMALRLILKGYIVRWATYAKGGFKEGVSLSVDDELNRWQKYSYGCNELLFNPLAQWWRRGPITRQIHTFLWSKTPLHYKISMMSYMFSYYGIAASITISLINYVLLGFQFPVDGFFMHSFEIFLATTVVFWGSGTVGYTLLEYRLGHKKLLAALFENLLWIPFFFFFFGGLSIPVTQAILAHLFSYDIQWSATVKEVERSNFFKEIPKIAKRFWFPMTASVVIMVGMIICATPLVPFIWKVDGSAWAVILPLALSVACHILFPIVLNPWLMVFSY